MADKEEIEIEIDDKIDDKIPEKEIEVETKKSDDVQDEGKAAQQALQDQLDLFRKEQARDRAARIAAEQRAEQAEKLVDSSRRDALTNAIGLVESEIAQVSAAYKSALEAGDFEAAAKAQREIARHEARLVTLEDGKTALEDQSRMGGAKKPLFSDVQDEDPVEMYLSKLSPRSQDYLRRNMSFVTDPRQNKRMMSAHYEAEAEGFVPDSDAYFDFIDKKMGVQDAKTPVKAHSRAAPAAPVSRNTHAANGDLGGKKVVKLTSSEVATAEALGLTTAEYARRKIALQEQGAFDRSN